ncbi:MAG: peptidyl-prolyl cis-trans isomerase SurA [Verrucomicrobiales bacterium]|jgi:peptidyl-prolyl cis-trans isomerase SurA
MKRISLLTFILIAIASVTSAAEPYTGIAAVVNGKVITTSEVRNAAQVQVQMIALQNRGMTNAEAAAMIAKIEKSALQDLIDRELILVTFKEELGATIARQHVDEAVNRFIRERFDGDRTAFVKEMEKSGLSLQQFREMQEDTIIIQAMRSKNAGTGDVIVTPQERLEFWKSNKALFSSPGRVKMRTITIPKEADGNPQLAFVEEIRGKLTEGADFATMARTYSIDSAAQNGGQHEELGPGDINSALAEAAFSIPIETVSKIIDLGTHYALVYVDARQDGAIAPLSEVEDEVHRRVLQNKRQEKVTRWLERLRRDANVRIFG